VYPQRLIYIGQYKSDAGDTPKNWNS
jgi:hypothetical protein